MTLTLACSGMDAAIEAEFKAAFAGVGGQLHRFWQLVDVERAEHVVVDMDSVSGPMHWLRLHNAGKYVIAMTVAPRARTHYHLERPVSVEGLSHLLQGIAHGKGLMDAVSMDEDAHIAIEPVEVEPAPPEFNADAIAGMDEDVIQDLLRPRYPKPSRRKARAAARAEKAKAVAARSGDTAASSPPSTPATHPQDSSKPAEKDTRAAMKKPGPVQNDEDKNPPAANVATPVPASIKPPAATPLPAGNDSQAAEPATADHPRATVMPPAPQVPADLTPPRDAKMDGKRRIPLGQWLQPGVLSGRLRLRSSRAPTLYIDAQARHYYGPATLKPLTGAFDGEVNGDEFETLSVTTWQREIAMLGPPRPLVRLMWYAALLAGKGQLANGLDPNARYQLLKWPETEREFPRHFRIATAMMKGPATLEEIAAASSASVGEVADFVNASLVSGHTFTLGDGQDG